MKTLYLLFAVACLVFHTQANPRPPPEDAPQDEPKLLDTVEDNVEDADDSDGQSNPMMCSFSGGTCKTSCLSTEVLGGVCYSGYVCCFRSRP